MEKRNIKSKTKPDRRILKTKRYLAEALKELIVAKGYDAVTIQDIIDRANVGRSTFYSHYENKEQLLIGNINFQEALIDTPDDGGDYPMNINLSYLFNHTSEHLPVVRAMWGTRGIEVLKNHFTAIIAGKIMDHDKTKSTKDKTQKMLRYKAEAKAGGVIHMLFKWLEDGPGIPAKEMILFAKELLKV